MRLLIDSHALLWAVDDPAQLGKGAMSAIRDPGNERLLSAGRIWEISIKAGLGKLALSIPYKAWMTQAVADLRLTLLPITIDHADLQANLPSHHRDPFDRLLIAQSLSERIPVVTADAMFDAYGVTRIWD